MGWWLVPAALVIGLFAFGGRVVWCAIVAEEAERVHREFVDASDEDAENGYGHGV